MHRLQLGGRGGGQEGQEDQRGRPSGCQEEHCLVVCSERVGGQEGAMGQGMRASGELRGQRVVGMRQRDADIVLVRWLSPTPPSISLE